MDEDKNKNEELTPEELEELNNLLGLTGEEKLSNEDIKDIKDVIDEFVAAILGGLSAKPVKTTTAEHFKVDTAQVFDREYPYEIAVCHEDFNNGQWVIVASAKTEKEAIKKHDNIVQKIAYNKVTYLRDIYDGRFYLPDIKSE
jgi:hypothetical protein